MMTDLSTRAINSFCWWGISRNKVTCIATTPIIIFLFTGICAKKSAVIRHLSVIPTALNGTTQQDNVTLRGQENATNE